MAGKFHFKSFSVAHGDGVFKVNTDGVILGAWVDLNGVQRILDIGTGSGLVALMCAQRNDAAKIDAIDLDPSSVLCAIENFTASPWSSRLSATQSDLRAWSVGHRIYDLVVSNPPFFEADLPSVDFNRKRGRHLDGMTLMDWVNQMSLMLTDGGRGVVILPSDSGKKIMEKLSMINLYSIQVLNIRPRTDLPFNRMILEFGRIPAEMTSASLTLYTNKERVKTKEFADLVRNFYLYE